MAYQILKRKKQRINLMLSGFLISATIGNILNMFYAVLTNNTVILILHFLTLFFIFFGIVFVFIVNMIILESTLVFSVKRQNRYIVLYGTLLFFGMLILLLLPFDLVEIHSRGYPIWHPIFFFYVVSIITGFAIIPLIYTNFKIYFRFETKALKRKWLGYLIGSLGVITIMYLLMINNLLVSASYRSIISIAGFSIVLWVSLMYYGIGSKLKS